MATETKELTESSIKIEESDEEREEQVSREVW